MKTKTARSARRYKIINSPILKWIPSIDAYIVKEEGEDKYTNAICDRYIARFLKRPQNQLPDYITFQISRQKFNKAIRYPFKFNTFGVRHGSQRGGLYRWAQEQLLEHYPCFRNKDVYLYVRVKPQIETLEKR